jgi:hypothetical protein
MNRPTRLVAVLALVLPLSVSGMLMSKAGAANRESAGPFCATLFSFETYRATQPGLFTKGTTKVTAYLSGLEKDVPYLRRATGEAPTLTLEYAFAKAVVDQNTTVAATKDYLSESKLFGDHKLSDSVFKGDVAADNKKQEAGLGGVASVLSSPAIGVFCSTG